MKFRRDVLAPIQRASGCLGVVVGWIKPPLGLCPLGVPRSALTSRAAP